MPHDVQAPEQDVISSVWHLGHLISPEGTASPHTGHGLGTLRGKALGTS